jgi:transcriptional regulator with XRE-family HTH domain
MGEDLAVTLGKRIRRLRRKRSFTQETLAGLVGTSQGHLGKIERGEVQVGTELLQKIASALVVDIANFFQGRDDLPRDVVLKKTISMINNSSERDLYLIYKIVDSIVN